MKLLVDTGALLALAMQRDRHHRAAVEFVRRSPNARLVLTDLILAEFVTRVRARGGAHLAVKTARNLLASRRYELVFVDAALLERALDQMTRFDDKRLSLIDCVSFAVMADLGIRAAFSFDRDFRDCGFEMVP